MKLLMPSLVAGVGAALCAAVPAAGGPASLPTASCGGTITTNVKLTTDLQCTTGPGLVVGADHVTVDLGGHTIVGNVSSDGVLVDGHRGVTVKNGAVAGFGRGLAFASAPEGKITGVVVRGGGNGVSVDAGSAETALTKDTIVGVTNSGVTLLAEGSRSRRAP